MDAAVAARVAVDLAAGDVFVVTVMMAVVEVVSVVEMMMAVVGLVVVSVVVALVTATGVVVGVLHASGSSSRSYMSQFLLAVCFAPLGRTAFRMHRCVLACHKNTRHDRPCATHWRAQLSRVATVGSRLYTLMLTVLL